MNKVYNKIANSFGIYFDSYDSNNFDKVNSDLVRFFKIEYGSKWKYELQHYLYKKKENKQKKAA
tara:strand:+ start:167 stop:358 length:192 start_codon:yes stop_codon:yes gene_type:complete